MGGLCIKSDYIDYYDYLHNENSIVTYKRYLSDCKQRGTALKYLRSLGIKTITIKPVSDYIGYDGYLLVYTDTKGHHGTGKKILTVQEAMQSYSNCAATQFYSDSNFLTAKFLQIGKRRFTMYFKKSNEYSLSVGTLIDIRETPSEYNRLISLPIFSIDYICVNNEMLATDFNEVEYLKGLNVDNFMSAEQVVDEIRRAVIVYNKI